MLPSPTMPPGGKREGAGRLNRKPYTNERPNAPKVNRAIPMTEGEWALVKKAAAATLKERSDGKLGPTPAAEWERSILLDVATGAAVVTPAEPSE